MPVPSEADPGIRYLVFSATQPDSALSPDPSSAAQITRLRERHFKGEPAVLDRTRCRSRTVSNIGGSATDLLIGATHGEVNAHMQPGTSHLTEPVCHDWAIAELVGVNPDGHGGRHGLN